MFGIWTNTPIDLHNVVARHGQTGVCESRDSRGVLARSQAHVHDLGTVGWDESRDQLGHSSVLMTLDVYSHAQDRVGEAALIEQYAWPQLATEMKQ
jgi:hypothetical protein